MASASEGYGLSPRESRMVGLTDDSVKAANRDLELEGAILRHLRSMGADQVHVAVRFGKATLSGFCDDFAEKRSIYSAARSMAGEDRVVNNIRVLSSDTGMPGRYSGG